MPQITNVRVMRFRKVQPEQFGGAGAEVELHATVLEGEDYRDISRGLLFDARAMVYENLGMKLPKKAFDADKELGSLTAEKATAGDNGTTAVAESKEVVAEGDAEPAKEPAKKKRGGRPKGSKNKPKSAETSAKEPAKEPVKEPVTDPAESEVPGAEPKKDMPQISTNPEDRKDPAAEEDEVPGAKTEAKTDTDAAAKAAEKAEDLDWQGLYDYINDSIRNQKITGAQGKAVLTQMGVARVRDLDTPEKLAQAKMLIDALMEGSDD